MLTAGGTPLWRVRNGGAGHHSGGRGEGHHAGTGPRPVLLADQATHGPDKYRPDRNLRRPPEPHPPPLRQVILPTRPAIDIAAIEDVHPRPCDA